MARRDEAASCLPAGPAGGGWLYVRTVMAPQWRPPFPALPLRPRSTRGNGPGAGRALRGGPGGGGWCRRGAGRSPGPPRRGGAACTRVAHAVAPREEEPLWVAGSRPGGGGGARMSRRGLSPSCPPRCILPPLHPKELWPRLGVRGHAAISAGLSPREGYGTVLRIKLYDIRHLFFFFLPFARRL